MAEADADGYERRGKVFSLRLSDQEREQLRHLYEGEARELIPWGKRSLGGFLVWAALQWNPRQQQLPHNGRGSDGKVYRNGVVVARRVKTKRARGGTTGRRRSKRKGRK